MNLTDLRRLVAPLIALVLLVGGCASDTDRSEDVGDRAVATGGPQFSTADEETAKLGTTAKAGEFPRTITHALGETTIKTKPKRVVVLDSGELDHVLALGIKPVGLASADATGGLPSYLEDKIAGVDVIGTHTEINLEALAALKPDLILGSKLRVAKLYDQLSAIAPTVFSIRPGFPWKENFLLAADALGKEEKAVDVLNEYQAKADEVGNSIKGDPTVSIVRFMSGKTRLYANLSFIGVILNDIGLKRPAVEDVDDLAVEVSAENIKEVTGDWVFYSNYGAEEEQKTVLGGQLWSEIPAVANGQSKAVNDDTWFLGLGPVGAMSVLDDLEKIFT
ncbi:iron complex transport system substrate-binding protein [Antricoccus suffuscus]|uniref:Iron complex transport system substrate-binding protein n=1 Tax=Antricoccus suffuscus TaxID=1629062 RepID=A0A2T1A4F3_9ACTN|nr:iron-siderophore ABC transporter substrate-binding protein [Antricoccus suffuscus]PRZ43480.1 iron complex transport system substrate-binding protein [Antricoccus suffuscus]